MVRTRYPDSNPQMGSMSFALFNLACLPEDTYFKYGYLFVVRSVPGCSPYGFQIVTQFSSK